MRVRRKQQAARRANDGTAKHNGGDQSCSLNFTKLECVQQVRAFRDVIYEPDDKLDIRALREREGGPTKSCLASKLIDLVDWMRKENEAGRNIYIGINSRKRLGGSKAEDVALARVLVADWDDVEDINEARKRWEDVGMPEPSLLVSSGHGFHAYWRLETPITALAEWTQLQKALAIAVKSDPKICDPPRIMRLPGFMNCKEAPVPCVII